MERRRPTDYHHQQFHDGFEDDVGGADDDGAKDGRSMYDESRR